MSCTAAAAVELPEEVWTQILQHVDYKQRLSACALVCQKLAKAAAAATTSVTLQLYSDSSQRHNSFLSYTRSYGSSLTRLHLSSSPDHAPIRQLPCPHLLELELNFCSVQLCAGSEGLGLLHSCPALTRLVLRAPTLLDGSVAGPAGAAPSAVAQLQSFALEGCDRPGEADHDSRAAQALQDRLLPHLTSLTHLSIQAASTSVDQYLNTVGASLPNEPVQSCFLQHISSMVRLKQLSMKHGNGLLSNFTLPGIEHLTALEDFLLRDCNMDPSCLLRMTTQLTGFHLSDVHIWDGQPPAPHGQASTVRASQLLRVLARLSELRTLELDGVSCEWPEQQLSLYSAMITSTNLQRLIVRTGMETEGWEQVFPAGCKLPHLRTLLLDRLADDECESLESLSPETLARLGSCCPGLQQLRFIAPPVDSVAALRALTALTQLDVRGAEPRIVDDLTALTQLQDLRLVAAWYWGDEDQDWTLHHLVSLAALTSLTSLECPADQEVEEEGVLEHRFVNKAPDGAPPDVWVQLLEHCAQYEVAPLPDIRPLVRQLRQLQEQRAVAKAAGTGLPAGFEEACEELEAKLDEAAALQGPQG